MPIAWEQLDDNTEIEKEQRDEPGSARTPTIATRTVA